MRKLRKKENYFINIFQNKWNLVKCKVQSASVLHALFTIPPVAASQSQYRSYPNFLDKIRIFREP